MQPPSLAAQPEDITATPYNVQVVLHVVENRFLTPLFQQKLQAEVGDHLQTALGKLAKVDVVRTHSLLADIEAQGLGPVLDAWDVVSGVRTCFVLVEYAAGRYSVQVRQHDGFTGLATPHVRSAQVSDRSRLAGAAVDLLRGDFGLVGRVANVADNNVTLDLVAGKSLGDPAGWLPAGRVFVLCRVSREGEGARSTRVPWAVLQVQPSGVKDGRCVCRLWNRFKLEDFGPPKGNVEYRCLLWPTTESPLRLRFIDDQTFQPLPSLVVKLVRPGEEIAFITKTTDPTGLLDISKAVAHLVIVEVHSGGSKRQLPVEIVDDRTVVCRLKMDEGADKQAALDYRVRMLERRIIDNLRLASDRLVEINDLILGSLQTALETARQTEKNLDAELGFLGDELKKIRVHAIEMKVTPPVLASVALLDELDQRRKEMKERGDRYETAVKDSKDDTGLRKYVEKAKLHEDLAEFEDALTWYQKALKVYELKNIRAHLDGLQKAWTVHGPEHAEARKFVYEVWPHLEPLDMEKSLARAGQTLETFRKYDDKLTPLRFMKANVVHTGNVQKKLEALARVNNEDSRNQAQIIRRVARQLLDLELQARAAAGKTVKKTAE